MNVQEIKNEIANLINKEERLDIKISFDLIQDAIYSVKDKSNMDIGVIDYCSIYFYQITEGCKALLSHLDLTLDFEVDENGLAVNPNEALEMYREIYDFVDDADMNVFLLYESILKNEKALAEKEYIQLGATEGRLVNMLEKLTESVGKISEVATDKKKLKPLLAELKKSFPQLGEIVKEVK